MKQLSHFPSFPSHCPKKPINPIPKRAYPNGITQMHHFSFTTNDDTTRSEARAFSCAQASSLWREPTQLEGNSDVLGHNQAPLKHKAELLLCCIHKYQSRPF